MSFEAQKIVHVLSFFRNSIFLLYCFSFGKRVHRFQEIIIYRRSELKRPPIAQPVINSLIHQVHLKDLLPQSTRDMDYSNTNDDKSSRKFEEMKKEAQNGKELNDKLVNEQ